MASMQKIILIGNVGAAGAELRYDANGSARSSFGLAVNGREKVNGEWQDKVQWYNVTLFGDRAENLSQYIVKGKQLYIEGRPQLRTWEKDGKHGASLDVIANDVQLLGGKSDD